MEKEPLIRVLLVEDNPADARLVEVTLCRGVDVEFELDWVDRLDDALVRLAAEPPIDVVLADLGLPDSHGLETYEKINERAPGVAVVLMTGLDDDETALAAVKRGAQDYIVKGATDKRFLTRVLKYAVERKQAYMHERQRAAELERAYYELEKAYRDLHTTQAMLMRELLDLSPRPGKPVLRRTKLTAIVEAARKLVDSELSQRDIRVVTEVTHGLPEVLVDDRLMMQVFLNLFLNAVEAMDREGKLTIRFKSGELARRDVVGVRLAEGPLNAGDRVVVCEIADTGVGIGEDVLARVFDPFFTTKSGERPMGLGLSVAHNVVHEHSGLITLQSAPGRGTTARVLLPAAA
jgi:signal transduction histidine kinase